MKYNLAGIMCRAWELRRAKGYTLSTALKLARYVHLDVSASARFRE